MKKQTIAIVLGIALISLASAIYAGECEQVDLSGLESLDNVVYISVGNQSNLEGLNVTLNGTFVDICPVINYKPDNFTLIFWDDSPEIVETERIVIQYRGGGGFTKYVDKNVTQYIERLITQYYTNDTICEETIEEIIEEEKVGFFKRIWNWIKGIFGGDANHKK